MPLAPYWVGATSSLVGPTHWQSIAAHLAASLGSSTLEIAIKLYLSQSLMPPAIIMSAVKRCHWEHLAVIG